MAEEASVSTEPHRVLRLVLPHLLDDEADVGLARIDDAPAIIALSSTRLLCLRVTDIGCEASEPELRIDAAPLSPETAIEIEATLEFRPPRASFLALTWTLSPAGGGPLTFTTLRPLGNFHSYYAGGDQVMVAAAKILGWPVPGAG